MKKCQFKEIYQMMFPEYPDIVDVRQLQKISSAQAMERGLRLPDNITISNRLGSI